MMNDWHKPWGSGKAMLMLNVLCSSDSTRGIDQVFKVPLGSRSSMFTSTAGEPPRLATDIKYSVSRPGMPTAGPVLATFNSGFDSTMVTHWSGYELYSLPMSPPSQFIITVYLYYGSILNVLLHLKCECDQHGCMTGYGGYSEDYVPVFNQSDLVELNLRIRFPLRYTSISLA